MPDKVTFREPSTVSQKREQGKTDSKVSYTWLQKYYVTMKRLSRSHLSQVNENAFPRYKLPVRNEGRKLDGGRRKYFKA